MEQFISWKKSYLISILIHLLLAVVLGLTLVSVVEHKQTENAFEIDMSISEDLKASAGGGGGGGGVSFPQPLSQEVVQAKVQAAQQSISSPVPVEDAVNVPTSTSTSATGRVMVLRAIKAPVVDLVAVMALEMVLVMEMVQALVAVVAMEMV